jgi:acetyl-CoA synthetase
LLFMPRLTDYAGYQDAQREFAPARLWELFGGDRSRLNMCMNA